MRSALTLAIAQLTQTAKLATIEVFAPVEKDTQEIHTSMAVDWYQNQLLRSKIVELILTAPHLKCVTKKVEEIVVLIHAQPFLHVLPMLPVKYIQQLLPEPWVVFVLKDTLAMVSSAVTK